MSACITITNLSSRGEYGVLDPRRTNGFGPGYERHFGYPLAADGLVVSVKRNRKLSGCEMRVALTTMLAEPKDILAWNFFSAGPVGRIGSPGLGFPSSMTITRSSSMGLACGLGTDTIVLRRRSQAFNNWQAWYLFSPADFWDFWGGFNVTIDWFNDTSRGLWADQIPPLTYPRPLLPDLTLMRDPASGHFSLVVGGTDFAIAPNFVQFLGALGVSPNFAVPSTPLPPSPVDFTLVTELFRRNEIYVVFGGARFRITDLAVLSSLGFSANQVRTLPPGGFAKLHKYPFDGTFLREQNSSKVYLVEKKKLRLVTKAMMPCISPRNVRVVPDKALASLAKGPDF
jgi:hypothetical protein